MRLRILGGLGLLLFMTLGALSAWNKGLKDQPEWHYYRILSSAEFHWSSHDATGAYLPGAGIFFRPFFLFPKPLGLGIFILLNLAFGIWLCRQLLQTFLPGDTGRGSVFSYWHYLWIWPPIHLSIQNNQLTVGMTALVVAAFLRLERGRKVAGGVLLAIATGFKTLPFALAPFLILRRRWKPALILVFGALLISFVGFWAVHGLEGVLRIHREWVAAVRSLDPASCLDGTPVPRFFRDNM